MHEACSPPGDADVAPKRAPPPRRKAADAWEAVWQAAVDRGLPFTAAHTAQAGNGDDWRFTFQTVQLACSVSGLELMETPETYARKLAQHKGPRVNVEINCRRAAAEGKPPGEMRSVKMMNIPTTEGNARRIMRLAGLRVKALLSCAVDCHYYHCG